MVTLNNMYRFKKLRSEVLYLDSVLTELNSLGVEDFSREELNSILVALESLNRIMYLQDAETIYLI